MSEQPREHDKIRVTVVGEYSPDHDGDAYVLLADDVAYPILADATVEVLERADDPSKSLRGEVRECEPGLPAVCYGKDFWIFFRADGGPGYSVYRDVQMVGKPVIGAVPGTPAAEAETPGENSHENHCKDLAEAIYASHIYPWEDLLLTARRYAVHAMRDESAAERADEEYPEVSGAGVPFPADATPLPKPRDLCALDDCPAAPRCSSGAAVWHDRTSECRPSKREPRVFQSDGPEPPADVTALEDEGPDWGDMKYLLRTGDLWCWSPSPKLVWPDHSDPVLWERAARQAAGPFREVV